MTAQVFTAVRRPATTFSTEKKKGGSYLLSSTEKTSLSTTTDVKAALDILSTATRRAHTVGPNKIGKATSTLN